MGSNVDLGFALNLPNAKAIDYFTRKTTIGSDALYSLGESAHAKAFTLANINNLNLLQDVKSSLDKALKEGQGFNEWKNELLDTAKVRGWTNNGDLFDPQTGMVIAPHRLGTIFHTNMNGAFQAARYQSQMENAAFMPFWELVAVGDERTRPSHMALSGTIKRYDDEFWQTHYPPLGWRCRCTVIPRSDYYMEKNELSVNDDATQTDKDGNPYFERIGQKVYPDKGFAYNQCRHGFKPNLDDYVPQLAQRFAEADMASPEFKLQYDRLHEEYIQTRNRLGVAEGVKLSQADINEIRNTQRYHLNFTAGIIPADIGVTKRTVWLSDDTLLKQFNSRLNDPNINKGFYGQLPALINEPDFILNEKGKYLLLKKQGDRWARVLIRHTKNNELYIDSVYLTEEKRARKLIETLEVIKKP